MTEDNPHARDERGHFLPGHSIRRPPGRTQADLVRLYLEPHREALLARALALTKSSDGHDVAAGLKLCLERLAPIPRPEAEKVAIPGLAEQTTFGAKCDAVIRAVAAGEVSAEAGLKVLGLLDVCRRAFETDTNEKRLSALERGKIYTPPIETATRLADLEDDLPDLA